MTLTNAYIVDAIAEKNGMPRREAVHCVESALEILKSKLGSGDDVLISGFGKFCVKHKRERRGVIRPRGKTCQSRNGRS